MQKNSALQLSDGDRVTLTPSGHNAIVVGPPYHEQEHDVVIIPIINKHTGKLTCVGHFEIIPQQVKRFAAAR